MRKFLLLCLVIISIEGFAQPTNYIWYKQRTRQYSMMIDSMLFVPRYNGTPSGVRVGEPSAIDGAVAIDTANNRFYIRSGGAWVRVANYSEVAAGLQPVLAAGRTLSTNDSILFGGYVFKFKGGELIISSDGVDNGDYTLQNTGGAYFDVTGKNLKLLGIEAGEIDSVYGKNAAGNVGLISVDDLPAGGGGGSTSLTGRARYALRFPGYSGSNVYTGYFHPVGIPFYDCFYEGWVRVDSSGYLWSDGYGAIHTMLFGLNASESAAGISGNMYDEYSHSAFDAWDQFALGTAHHVAVSYDRSNVITYIDGVPSKKTARTVKRQSVAESGSGGGYLGGSDHLNFKGTLFSFRIHEYGLPFYIGTGGIFYPKRELTASNNNVVYCMDVDNISTNVIEDKSGGFYGQKHDGYRQYSEGGDPIYPQRESGLDSVPQFVVDSIVQSDYQWGQTTAPVGAKIYDFFERQDQVPAYQGNGCTLDSTKGGSLGKKKYTVVNGGMYGIINGYAWSNAVFSSYVKVTSNSSTQDIRVTYANTTSEEDFGILGLLTDDNNKVYAFVDGNGANIRLYKYAAGVFTNLGYYNQTVSFNELKLTISGGTANVYADGVLRITGDVSDVPSSNNVGFAINSPFTRIKKFEVY